MDKIGLNRVTHYTLTSGVNGELEELDYRTRPHAALPGWWIGETVFSNHEKRDAYCHRLDERGDRIRSGSTRHPYFSVEQWKELPHRQRKALRAEYVAELEAQIKASGLLEDGRIKRSASKRSSSAGGPSSSGSVGSSHAAGSVTMAGPSASTPVETLLVMPTTMTWQIHRSHIEVIVDPSSFYTCVAGPVPHAEFVANPKALEATELEWGSLRAVGKTGCWDELLKVGGGYVRSS